MKKIVKGVVLAGGKGTRLKPLTDNLDKPLLPINGKPMILYSVEKLVEAGIKDIIVVIPERNKQRYEELFQEGKPFGAEKITYVIHPEEVLGMPKAISLAKEHVSKNEAIAVLCADVIMEGSIVGAKKIFNQQEEGALMLVNYIDNSAGFSLIEVKDDLVTRIYSKDSERKEPGLIDLGAGFYNYDVFEKIESLYPSESEVGIWELNQLYLDDNKLAYYQVSGKWYDAGKSLDLYNSIKNQPRILILGAGMAGLSAAIHLRRSGYETLILEKESYAGGLFTNSSVEGCDFDYGPKILLLDESENSKEILQYLDNDFDKLPVQESVYLQQYGLLHYPLQRHLIDLPSPLREKIITDLHASQQTQTSYTNFREWLISHFGKLFSEMILIPYEEKKWRIDLSKMDYRWALKRPIKVDINEVIEGAQKLLPPKKWYYYPKKGNISTFTNRLVDKAGPIAFRNEVLKLDLQNRKLTTTAGTYEYDAIISTIPLDYVSSITTPLPTYLKNNSKKLLKRLSIAVINLVYEGNHKLDGTAIYIPEKDFIFRRVSVLENLCPALGRKGKTPISVEVSIDPDNKMSEDELYNKVLEDLAKIPQFSQLGKPIAHEVRTVDFAYPLQIRGHSYHVGELHRYFVEHDIYHCGRGGSYDYCNGDEAYYLGGLMAKRLVKNLSYKSSKADDFSITVGIPSYNSGESIINTVKSIQQSRTNHKINVIVSVDGPTMSKDIEAQLKKLAVKIIHNQERQGQTARNAQIANVTKTDLLIMTQDDVVFSPTAIEEITDAFSQDKQLTMVAPSIEPLPSKVVFEEILKSGVSITRSISKGWNNGDNYLSSIGRCLAYRTEMVQQFNIDEKIINCDAFYYFENKRLGGKFAYIDKAKIYYRLPQNMDDHLKQVRKFVVSQSEMNNYLKTDLHTEYTLPRNLFIKAVLSQLVKNPLNTFLYLATSIYARTRPKSFYNEVTRFWEVDKSTKNN